MNKIKISIFALALSMAVVSCDEDAKAENNHSTNVETATNTHEVVVETIAKNINADEFKGLVDAGKGFVLDVRTAGEVANGSIAGNTNIDFYSSDFKSEVEKLDKNAPVYVYCAAGGRSGKAMGIMKNMGFKEVYNLVGGYGAWPFK